MAKSVALQLSVMILVVLVTAPMVRPQREERSLNRSPRQFTVYLQQIFGGPSANVFPVAGRSGQPRTLNDFGTIFTGSVPATKDISIDSQQVGLAEGIIAVSSLNATELYYSFSIIFNEVGEYKGSTLQFQGTLKLGPSGNTGEVSVTSGTKHLRFAKGFASARTVLQNAATNYAVNKVDITIRFDD